MKIILREDVEKLGKAGEVVKVHPENGQPVQYGDPLFTVRPA